MVAVILLGATSSYAGTYTYSFDKSLGIIKLDESPRRYDFAFDSQFSSIDSVTYHLAGYLYSGKPDVKAVVTQCLMAYKGGDMAGVGAAACYSVDSSFDWTHTIPPSAPAAKWREYLCQNDLEGWLYFYMGDYSLNPDGYANITSANVTIVGTKVPEPSAMLALLCGVSGIVWRLRRSC